MNSDFTVGKKYAREALLDFVGSKQQQSGIIWGNLCPEVVICTSGGKHGAEAAYSDQQNPDGTWLYFGQGAKGNQDPNAFANQLLVKGQRSVLFFTTREPSAKEKRLSGSHKKQYTFVGEFCVGSWESLPIKAGKRQGDQLLKFTLVPSNGSGDDTEISNLDDTKVFNDNSALQMLNEAPKRGLYSAREYFIRSILLKKHIRLRAGEDCEYCKNPAPFKTSKGAPYLEVHHILRLADGGPDNPLNVIALCPNCHRRAHYADNANMIKEELLRIAKFNEELYSQKQSKTKLPLLGQGT